MDCIKNNKQGVEILTDYCAGTAAPTVAAEIDTHIEQCAECRTTIEAQRAVWQMLDAWSPVEVSPDFDSQLYARIASQEGEPAWRRWLSRILQPATPYSWWKPAASLAAAGAVLSLALVMYPPPGRTVLGQQKSTIYQSAAVQAPANSGTGSAVSSGVNPAAGSSDEIDLQKVQQALDDLDIVAPVSQTSSPL